MATICISALSSGENERRSRLLNLTKGLSESNETVSLLLYGDGVYNLVNGSQSASQLIESPLKIYVIAGDIEDRGLAGKIVSQAEQIDYDQAVKLVMEADRTITGV